ncbi:hypothetical protein SEA_INKED_7 [Arthrobacter phage Inked]|nr:hypothetical protein SEA_INKED_7 [Arthrobacter phage Inked]
MANDNAHDFLEHYGIKGMRWGKRKAGDVEKATVSVNNKEVDAGPVKASTDAVTVGGYKSRVAAGGIDALSTKELQTLVNRQNLEQQYERLNPAPMTAGQKFMKETLPTVVDVAKVGYGAYRTFYPAKEPPPMSTDLRVVSGKQKAGDMMLHLGKEVVKNHGMALGKMAFEAMMSK